MVKTKFKTTSMWNKIVNDKILKQNCLGKNL